MILKIAAALVVVLVLFLAYVSTRDGHFLYERSGVINAPAERIFPYLSQYKLGHLWSPYEKGIEMPKTFSEVDGAVGSWMEFGPSKSGSGRIEILELVPNQMVKMSLHMTAPIEGKNIVIYRLTPEGTGTKFSWSMEGEGGFMGKLMAVLIDCEKMVAGQFTEGINSLKAYVESEARSAANTTHSSVEEVAINLTEKAENVDVPAQHYLYVEKIGPFQETAQKAWEEVHKLLETLHGGVHKTGAMALFKMEPQMVYRAGFALNGKPQEIPKGLEYVQFRGGKYAKYVLKGSYKNLGPAWGKTIENFSISQIPKRDDFYIENYVNDPANTPEDQLISELMIPIK